MALITIESVHTLPPQWSVFDTEEELDPTDDSTSNTLCSIETMQSKPLSTRTMRCAARSMAALNSDAEFSPRAPCVKRTSFAYSKPPSSAEAHPHNEVSSIAEHYAIDQFAHQVAHHTWPIVGSAIHMAFYVSHSQQNDFTDKVVEGAAYLAESKVLASFVRKKCALVIAGASLMAHEGKILEKRIDATLKEGVFIAGPDGTTLEDAKVIAELSQWPKAIWEKTHQSVMNLVKNDQNTHR